MITITEYTPAELLVALSAIVLLSLLLAELCDWTRVLFNYDNALCDYTYNELNELNGPLAWKDKLPDCQGDQQSPINISSSHAIVIASETSAPLNFSAEYHMMPKEFRAYNDGHSVTLYARWDNDMRPSICEGPLQHTYQFFNAHLRWGPNDEEGSEHTIDCQRFAMELQATHIKTCQKFLSLREAVENNAVVIVSYFFQVSPVDNPYLEPIVKVLRKIQCPFNCVNLELAPLSWFTPPFSSKYYTYHGSLTFPPCTEGVQWIIQPEPLAISSRQVRKFRKLYAVDGPLDINTRPVQEVNCRDVFYYD